MLYRRLLVDAINRCAKGEKVLMQLDADAARALTGPAVIDGIAPADRLEEYWQERDAARRRKAPWSAAERAA